MRSVQLARLDVDPLEMRIVRANREVLMELIAVAAQKKRMPVYQRLTPSGAVREQVVGVEARLKDGDVVTGSQVTWLVKAGSLGGLVPRKGDAMTDAHGNKWVITEVEVGETSGVYQCLCNRVGGDQ